MEGFEYKLPPYEWQKTLLAMSASQPDLAVLADMGTGKTKGIIDVLRYDYQKHKRVRKTLILAPLVTLYNWKDEFLKQSSIPAGRIHIMQGSTEKKLKTLSQAIASNPCQIVVGNYEMMISPKVVDELMKWAPEIMVLDESHYVKNHKAKRSKTIHLLAMKAHRKFIVSGTPMTNSLTDIFMQFKILDNGKTFGTNYYSFQRTYMYDENQSWAHLHNHFPKWRPRPEMLDELQQKIYAKGIRVNKEDCVDLPPFVQETYAIDLSPAQRKLYKQMEDDYVSFVEQNGLKGVSVAQTAMTKSLRLQQIVTGYVKLDDGQEIEIEDNPRLTALEELITALHEKHKVIIWCAFIPNYRVISKMLTGLGVKHVFITGEESLNEKKESMDALNSDPDVRVCIANRKAGGIGVNLVAASYSIVYSRNFSLEQELQSRDRNYRGGSNIHERITKIDLCARDTVDEAVTANLVEKKEVADRVIELVKERRTRSV
jgi:SNF2 family DNA or RNA helicase